MTNICQTVYLWLKEHRFPFINICKVTIEPSESMPLIIVLINSPTEELITQNIIIMAVQVGFFIIAYRGLVISVIINFQIVSQNSRGVNPL
jgi:hypothetical protein